MPTDDRDRFAVERLHPKVANPRHRPKAVRPIGDFAAARPTFKLAN